MAAELSMFTIYWNTRDYPGVFVVRRHSITRAGSVPRELLGRANTLAGARSLLPAGLVNLHREPGDDPVIVESWV